MELEKEPADRRRKRNMLILFFAFIGLLLFFTFFSSTLQTLALPKVRTETPVKGSLVFSLEASGILQPVAQARLANPAGWEVRKILVKEKDHVKKGQTLIVYDSKSAERQLEDEITDLNKRKIEQQDFQDQIIQSTQDGDELKLRKAKRDFEMFKLDVSKQERKINELRDDLLSQKEIKAPFDGTITKLNAVQGLVSEGEYDVVLTNSSLGFQLDITADSKLVSALGVSIGESIEVVVRQNDEQKPRVVKGTVDEVAIAQSRTSSSTGEETGSSIMLQQKVLRLKVNDSELKGGEEVEIKMENSSNQEGMVVSNEAIHNDREGMFVYKIDVEMGALSNEYVVRKLRIPISESNGKETMIQADSLYEDDLIILESSEPLEDGNRVRLQ